METTYAGKEARTQNGSNSQMSSVCASMTQWGDCSSPLLRHLAVCYVFKTLVRKKVIREEPQGTRPLFTTSRSQSQQRQEIARKLAEAVHREWFSFPSRHSLQRSRLLLPGENISYCKKYLKQYLLQKTQGLRTVFCLKASIFLRVLGGGYKI